MSEDFIVQTLIQSWYKCEISENCLELHTAEFWMPAGVKMTHISSCFLLQCLITFAASKPFLIQSINFVCFSSGLVSLVLLLCNSKSGLALSCPYLPFSLWKFPVKSSLNPFFPGWTSQLFWVFRCASCASVFHLLEGSSLKYLQCVLVSCAGESRPGPRTPDYLTSADQKGRIPSLKRQALVFPWSLICSGLSAHCWLMVSWFSIRTPRSFSAKPLFSWLALRLYRCLW